MPRRLRLGSYWLATSLCWFAALYVFIPLIPRILQGKTVSVVGVFLFLIVFALSAPLYLASWGEIRRWPYHVAYWMPAAITLAIVRIVGQSYAP